MVKNLLIDFGFLVLMVHGSRLCQDQQQHPAVHTGEKVCGCGCLPLWRVTSNRCQLTADTWQRQKNMYILVIPYAHVKRFSVSLMQNFKKFISQEYNINPSSAEGKDTLVFCLEVNLWKEFHSSLHITVFYGIDINYMVTICSLISSCKFCKWNCTLWNLPWSS